MTIQRELADLRDRNSRLLAENQRLNKRVIVRENLELKDKVINLGLRVADERKKTEDFKFKYNEHYTYSVVEIQNKLIANSKLSKEIEELKLENNSLIRKLKINEQAFFVMKRAFIETRDELAPYKNKKEFSLIGRIKSYFENRNMFYK